VSKTTAADAAGKFLNVDRDNLVADMILAAIALTTVLLAIALILLCIKYLYPKLPKVMKKLVSTVKSKLMWSSVLRYMTQSYLDQSILCMMSLQSFNELEST
jgi:hypothetical protein